MTRVIIVDDEIRSVALLEKYIETYMPDYCVCGTYYNGRDALEAFIKEPADIAVIDIEMPVINGITLIQEFNKITGNYVPIILSSYETFEYAKSAMKNGVEYYLSKPIDFGEVKAALEAAGDKLRFSRLLRSELTFDDDEREEYFVSLLDGQYPDSEIAKQQFEALVFPFRYENCCGSCFELRLDQVCHWFYGKYTLFSAVRNLLHTVYAPVFLVPIHQKGNRCSFVMVTAAFPDSSLGDFIRQGKEFLKADMAVISYLPFSSVDQLRTEWNTCGNTSAAVLEMEDYISHKVDIGKIVAYINEHYPEDLTRSAMARMIYMSDAYFSRCFKALTNTTFKSYLTKIRMEKAIELLSRDVKIQDIAQRVGYSNHTRFSIVFRQYTSYTPSEYRSVVLKRL